MSVFLIYAFLFSALIISLAALAFAVSALYHLLKVKVPFVRTPDWAVNMLLNKLKPGPNSVIYDLGCGDAKILITLKKAFPHIRTIGFELAWWPYLRAKHNIKKSGFHIDLRRGNFYHINLAEADIIFCFLIDSVMPALEKKLLAELKPEALVISYGFKFPNWQPKEIIPNPDKSKGSKINIYQK